MNIKQLASLLYHLLHYHWYIFEFRHPTMVVHFNIIRFSRHTLIHRSGTFTQPGTFMRMHKYSGRNTYASEYVQQICSLGMFSRRNKSAMTPARLEASKIVLPSMLINHSGTLGKIMEHLRAFLNENLSVQ